MKKVIYIILSIILGILLSTMLHAIVEIFIINLLTKDFNKYGLGLSWETWFLIHSIGTIILLVLGIVGGYLLGQRWWRIIYIEKKYKF